MPAPTSNLGARYPISNSADSRHARKTGVAGVAATAGRARPNPADSGRRGYKAAQHPGVLLVDLHALGQEIGSREGYRKAVLRNSPKSFHDWFAAFSS